MLPADDADLLREVGLSDAPERGLFTADAWLRRVAAEPAVLLGGGRALLLEVAHPLVAAGVAEHSSFRTDPFGRLRRTLEAMNAIAFGDRATALAAVRGIERAHRRVRGRLARGAGRHRAGTPYSGRDPELVRWVWATLADTSRVLYEHFADPLDAAVREAWYADQRLMAALLGVPALLIPADFAAFTAYFEGMLGGDELSVTDEAREIAAAVLDAPTGADAELVRVLTAGLLPPHLRDAFGLAWDAERAARLEALAASVRALRPRHEAVDAPPQSR